MFVDLWQKKIVVVGAGKIACRRIETLLQFTPAVTVIAPEIDPELLPLAEAGRLELRRKPYEPEDLAGADLVLAAAGDPAVNDQVWRDCRERRLPVNVSSDRAKCDFYFPGVARQGDLVVGVTASGRDHHRAKRATELLREFIREL
ncbi:MAG: bifunctional precorrin-2 dehydrogenase/sirohydrochlorin ferrochelatase [Firmicutes bacterium]|nr:bifunctional precorrin-2 dehydrogenase/sirohydrochlorin ferrochelatase [Bacillota bacterium]